jgi:hypothetical protein
MKATLGWVVAVAVLAAASGPAGAVERGMEGPRAARHATLARMVPQCEISLSEGVCRLLETSAAAPLAARFVLNEKGELVLEVTVAHKGLRTPLEANALEQTRTAVENAQWNPETGVLTDAAEITRSSNEFRQLNSSRCSLLGILGRAELDHKGKVVSIAPVTRNGKDEYLVQYADGDRISDTWYKCEEGEKTESAKIHKHYEPEGEGYPGSIY